MSPHSRLLPELQKHDVLNSTTDRYLVLEVVNRGSYGIVAKCVSLRAAKSTAVKIHFGDHNTELEMLQEIMELDPEKTNLVKFIESFTCQDMFCIAFEMLDKSLWDFMGEIRTRLSLNEIRPITHQLLVALEALKSRGIIHTNLKPDSVMLVNHQDQPFKLNLIDFGLAVKASEAKLGMELQPLSYRAPEVMLGLPLSEAMDMWSLGCVLAFLFFGAPLFSGNTTYDIMKGICNSFGQPKDYLLYTGLKTEKYFIQEQGSGNPQWRLKTPEEYKDTTDVQPETPEWFVNPVRNLKEKEGGNIELKDRMAFLDLLYRLFAYDANKRITPSQALKHKFLTMTHLENDLDTSSYAEAAFELMAVCPSHDSGDKSDEDTSGDVIICNNSTEYRAVNMLGKGSFGKVFMCVNTKTAEKVAIKIVMNIKDYITEVKMLKKIKTLDPDKTNVVKFIDNFMFQGMICVVFEMLDRNLWDFVKKTRTLSIKEIRTVTHQLLIAFEALKSLGIVHMDLKPDNVMLVNHQNQPFRVKLIDFGLAVKASKLKVGVELQILAYRPPEVMLGLPLSEAMDMWSLGCVVAFLFLGISIFPGDTSYDAMKVVCDALGQPADYLLNAGMKTRKYFIQKQGLSNPGWRLKTPEEYKDTTGVQPETPEWFIKPGRNLRDVLISHAVKKEKPNDCIVFTHIILQLLYVDPERRITPTQALSHGFITNIQQSNLNLNKKNLP